MRRRTLLLGLPAASGLAQIARSGKLIVTSGGVPAMVLFRKLAGTAHTKVVYVPTAASSLRNDAGVIWNPDLAEHREDFEASLARQFGVNRIAIAHTRDRALANSADFLEQFRDAQAVWISGGNAGRLAAAYLDTGVPAAIHGVLERGGVVAGESAGAIAMGSYIVRGNPDKPVLMVDGHDRGFGFLRNVAIDPHLSAAKRENELVSVVDRYPALLGMGIDDDTGLLVDGNTAEVFGKGRVAIYDNRKHKEGWYYWLLAGDRFDLRDRRPVGRAVE